MPLLRNARLTHPAPLLRDFSPCRFEAPPHPLDPLFGWEAFQSRHWPDELKPSAAALAQLKHPRTLFDRAAEAWTSVTSHASAPSITWKDCLLRVSNSVSTAKQYLRGRTLHSADAEPQAPPTNPKQPEERAAHDNAAAAPRLDATGGQAPGGERRSRSPSLDGDSSGDDAGPGNGGGTPAADGPLTFPAWPGRGVNIERLVPSPLVPLAFVATANSPIQQLGQLLEDVVAGVPGAAALAGASPMRSPAEPGALAAVVTAGDHGAAATTGAEEGAGAAQPAAPAAAQGAVAPLATADAQQPPAAPTPPPGGTSAATPAQQGVTAAAATAPTAAAAAAPAPAAAVALPAAGAGVGAGAGTAAAAAALPGADPDVVAADGAAAAARAAGKAPTTLPCCPDCPCQNLGCSCFHFNMQRYPRAAALAGMAAIQAMQQDDRAYEARALADKVAEAAARKLTAAAARGGGRPGKGRGAAGPAAGGGAELEAGKLGEHATVKPG